jgi:ABC-2 type transport system permease protein
MGTLTYDLKKAITSRGMLAVMIFMIVFSLAVIPLISQTTVSFQPGVNYNFSSYATANGFNVLLIAYNSFGQPLSGIAFNLTGVNFKFGKTVTTNSSGLVEFFVPANSTQGTLELNANIAGSSLSQTLPNQIIILNPGKPGIPNNLASIQLVTDASNSSRKDVFVFAVGPNFSKPDYSLYYTIIPASSIGGFPGPVNESNMKYLADIKDIASVVNFNVPSNVSANEVLLAAVFQRNGTLITSLATNVLSPNINISASQIASSFLSGILAVFVPLMAILGAYSIYGRDRVSGVLESVLVRPVTRRSLLLSRFIAGLIASAAAVMITILVVDLIFALKLNQYLSATFIFSSWASLVVEVAAFIGLLFAISQLTKSTGALIGAGIGLFLVLDFLWSLIIFLALSAAGTSFGSDYALHIETLLDFFNPSQYLALVQIYQTHTILNVPVNISSYGVTLATLLIDGLAWVLLPLLLALWLVVRKD